MILQTADNPPIQGMKVCRRTRPQYHWVSAGPISIGLLCLQNDVLWSTNVTQQSKRVGALTAGQGLSEMGLDASNSSTSLEFNAGSMVHSLGRTAAHHRGLAHITEMHSGRKSESVKETQSSTGRGRKSLRTVAASQLPQP